MLYSCGHNLAARASLCGITGVTLREIPEQEETGNVAWRRTIASCVTNRRLRSRWAQRATAARADPLHPVVRSVPPQAADHRQHIRADAVEGLRRRPRGCDTRHHYEWDAAHAGFQAHVRARADRRYCRISENSAGAAGGPALKKSPRRSLNEQYAN